MLPAAPEVPLSPLSPLSSALFPLLLLGALRDLYRLFVDVARRLSTAQRQFPVSHRRVWLRIDQLLRPVLFQRLFLSAMNDKETTPLSLGPSYFTEYSWPTYPDSNSDTQRENPT